MTDLSQRFLHLLEQRKYDDLRQALKSFGVNRHLKDQLLQVFDEARVSHITNVGIRCYAVLLSEAKHSGDECTAELRDLLLSTFPYDHREAFNVFHASGFDSVFDESILVKFLQKELLSADRSQQYISKCLALCDLSSANVTTLFLDPTCKSIVDALLPLWTYDEAAKFLLSHTVLVVRHIDFLTSIVSFLSSEHVARLECLLNPFTLTPSQCSTADAKLPASSSSPPSLPLFPTVADCDIDATRRQLLHVFLFSLASNKSVKSASCNKPPDPVGESVRLRRCSRPLATGETHTAIATADSVTIWGNTERVTRSDVDSPPLLPRVVAIPHVLPVAVTAVACGIQHTLAVTNVGVYGWGDSTYGQVGVANRCDGQVVGGAKRYAMPELLTALADREVVTVACGYYHSLALTSDFRVFAWGWGVHGQLGNERIADIETPEPMLQPKEVKVVDIAAGYAHSLVSTTEGEVWTCGSGCFGQLGHGDTTKRSRLTKVATLKEPVKAIASKLSHSLVVTSSGRVYTWGSSPLVLQQAMAAGRRLGRKQSSNAAVEYLLPSLVDISAVRGSVSSVACGSSMNALLTTEGHLYTWGRNYSNQLGFKDVIEKKRPSQVTYLNNCPPLTLASIGQNYMVVCDVEGNLCGWGSNEHSQLGLVNQHVVPSIFHSDESFVPLPRRLCALSPKVKGILGLGLPMPPRWSLSAKSDAEGVLDWCSGEVRRSLCTLVRVAVSFPRLIDVPSVIQMAVDNKAWCVAAVLSSLTEQRQLALRYQLKWRVSQLSSAASAEAPIDIVEFHIMLLVKCRHSSSKMDTATFEAELVKLCSEAIFFWCEHNLNSGSLEQMVLTMKDSLALPFLAALVRHRHPPAMKEDAAARCCPVSALSRSFLALMSALVLQKHEARLQAASDDDPYIDVSGEDLLLLLGNDCSVLS